MLPPTQFSNVHEKVHTLLPSNNEAISSEAMFQEIAIYHFCPTKNKNILKYSQKRKNHSDPGRPTATALGYLFFLIIIF